MTVDRAARSSSEPHRYPDAVEFFIVQACRELMRVDTPPERMRSRVHRYLDFALARLVDPVKREPPPPPPPPPLSLLFWLGADGELHSPTAVGRQERHVDNEEEF